jgi:hypothetical protein
MHTLVNIVIVGWIIFRPVNRAIADHLDKIYHFVGGFFSYCVPIYYILQIIGESLAAFKFMGFSSALQISLGFPRSENPINLKAANTPLFFNQPDSPIIYIMLNRRTGLGFYYFFS